MNFLVKPNPLYAGILLEKAPASASAFLIISMITFLIQDVRSENDIFQYLLLLSMQEDLFSVQPSLKDLFLNDDPSG